MEEEKTIANFSFFILRKFPRIRGMKINFTCIFTHKILNNTISLKSYHLTVEIINHAYYENSYVTVTKNFIHSKFSTRAESESVPPENRPPPPNISRETRNHLPGNRSNRLSKKKSTSQRVRTWKKKFWKAGAARAWKPRGRANIRCVEDLKKKNVSQPDTPKRVFQKRICVLIMSLVQTVEQRDAKGVRGKLVTLITVEPSPLFLSLALFLRVSFFLLFLSSPRRASSLSLSLSLIFFYFSFEALFNFCRGIFPVHSDYYSQEMEEENRSRELLWCKGVVTATTRGEKRFEEIVWKFLDNSVGRALYAIFWRFFPSLAQGKFSLNSTLSPLLSSIKIQNGRV